MEERERPIRPREEKNGGRKIEKRKERKFRGKEAYLLSALEKGGGIGRAGAHLLESSVDELDFLPGELGRLGELVQFLRAVALHVQAEVVHVILCGDEGEVTGRSLDFAFQT